MKKRKTTQPNDLTEDQRIELFQLKQLHDIEKFGCSIVGVFGGGIGFDYSVGIPTTIPGAPELMMYGLQHETMGAIINDVVSQMRDGKVFEAGKSYDGILKDYLVYFARVERQYYEDHFGACISYHGDCDFDMLQIVWTDTKGRFPWQKGFEEKFRDAQPLLFEPPK